MSAYREETAARGRDALMARAIMPPARCASGLRRGEALARPAEFGDVGRMSSVFLAADRELALALISGGLLLLLRPARS